MTPPPSIPHPARCRRALTLLAGVVLGLFALLAMPGKASAHAAIISTSPVQGSIVAAAPSEVVITFSEHVQAVRSHIQVIDPDGKKIGAGAPRVDGDKLRIPVRTNGPRGTYLVSFRVISADSHPVGGGFVYSVGAVSPGGAPSPINGGATDPVVATAVSVEQYLGFAGLILVVGPALVLGALWPRRLDRTGPTRLAFWGLGVLVAGALLGVYLEAPYGGGGGLFSASWSDVSGVLDTTYGKAHLVRVAVSLAALFLLRPMLAGRGGKWDRPLLAVLGGVAVLTWPLAGHAGSSEVPGLTVVADAVHLAAVAVWVGGLVMLAAYLLRRASARELGAILPVWSNWAMFAVTVLVLAGVAQALIQIGSFAALFHTAYGQLVIAKIALLAVILAFANVGRLIARRHASVPGFEGLTEQLAETEQQAEQPAEQQEPAGQQEWASAGASRRERVTAGAGPSHGGVIDAHAHAHAHGNGGGAGGDGPNDDDDAAGDDMVGDDADWDQIDDGGRDDPDRATAPREIERAQVRRLRRSVLAELVLAAAVLVASSILVQTTPARTAAAESAATANSPASATLNSALYSLQVDFSPIPTGAEIHMYAYTPQGAPLKVLEWTVTAAMPSRGIEPTAIDNLLTVTDSHAIAQATLPVKGDWTFSFTLRTSDIDEATVTTTVPIN